VRAASLDGKLHLARRIVRYCFQPTLALIPIIADCTQTPSINSADVVDVLTKTAVAAAAKLPASACISPKLSSSSVMWPAKAGPDGWVNSANTAEPSLRHISGPERTNLPDSALSAFANGPKTEDCRHRIVFEALEFVEVKTPTGIHIEARAAVADLCPLCGSGFEAWFRKIDGTWVMQPPGLHVTWYS
jgi:hypothetical protein